MSWIQLGYGQLTQSLGNNWGAGAGIIRFSSVAVGHSIVATASDRLFSISAQAIGQSLVTATQRLILRPSTVVIGEGLTVGRPDGIVHTASALAVGIAIIKTDGDEPPFLTFPGAVNEKFLGDAQKVNIVSTAPAPNIVRVIKPDPTRIVSPTDRFPFPGDC